MCGIGFLQICRSSRSFFQRQGHANMPSPSVAICLQEIRFELPRPRQERHFPGMANTSKTMRKDYDRLKELEDLYTRAAYLVHSTPEKIRAGKWDSPTRADTASEKPLSKNLSVKPEDLMTKFGSDGKSSGKRKR